MLKITLPNGVVIEGEGSEMASIIEAALQPKSPPVKPEPQPTLKSVPRNEPEQPCLPLHVPNDFPHKYAGKNRPAVNLGQREDQILQICKWIAEEKGFRHAEFETKEILSVVNDEATVGAVNSALQSLLRKQLVRHGKNNRWWYVTPQGYTSQYRLIVQSNFNSVRPTA